MQSIGQASLIAHYMKCYNIQEIFSKDIACHITLKTYAKGECICRVDEELTAFLFFVKGKAKTYATLKNGKDLLLSFYKAFDVVGDVELFGDGKAVATLECIEESHCLAVSREVMLSIIEKDTKVLRYVGKGLSQKLKRLSYNSAINLLYPLEERLASYLLAIACYDKKNRLVVQENLTYVAEILGTSYRHLLRTLKSFVEEGLVKKEGMTYVITKEEALKQLAADIYEN